MYFKKNYRKTCLYSFECNSFMYVCSILEHEKWKSCWLWQVLNLQPLDWKSTTHLTVLVRNVASNMCTFDHTQVVKVLCIVLLASSLSALPNENYYFNYKPNPIFWKFHIFPLYNLMFGLKLTPPPTHTHLHRAQLRAHGC